MNAILSLVFLIFTGSFAYAANVIEPVDFEVSERANVVIFGGEHKRPDIQDLMFEYIDRLNSKDKAFDCFFSEFDISAQDKINQFLSSELTYEESVLPFVEGRLNLLPKKIALGLKERGIKILPIDFVYNSERGKRFFNNSNSAKIFVEERSLLMAENTLAILESNKCKKGVFLVGQVHTWRHAFEKGKLVGINTIQSYFEELDMSADTFLLHNDGRVRGVTKLR